MLALTCSCLTKWGSEGFADQKEWSKVNSLCFRWSRPWSPISPVSGTCSQKHDDNNNNNSLCFRWSRSQSPTSPVSDTRSQKYNMMIITIITPSASGDPVHSHPPHLSPTPVHRNTTPSAHDHPPHLSLAPVHRNTTTPSAHDHPPHLSLAPVHRNTE